MNHKPDSRPAEIERLLITTAGEVAESFSLNRVVGQLYALLYINPDSVSLDTMAEKLRLSKGSVSVNIRILEEWGAARKVWVQGTRKDYYVADPDILKVVSGRLREGMSKRLSLSKSRIERLNSELKGKNGDAGNGKHDFYRDRIRKIEELHEIAEWALKILPKFESLKTLKGLKAFLH